MDRDIYPLSLQGGDGGLGQLMPLVFFTSVTSSLLQCSHRAVQLLCPLSVKTQKTLLSTGLKYNKDIYYPSTLPSSTFCFCLFYLLPHGYRVAATAHTSCPHSGGPGRNSPVVTQQQPPNAHGQKGGPQDHLCCIEAYLPRDC